MRDFFYLFLKPCYLRFQLAVVVFENGILLLYRRLVRIKLAYLLSKDGVHWQALQNIVNKSHSGRLLYTLHPIPNPLTLGVLDNHAFNNIRDILTAIDGGFQSFVYILPFNNR